ncbi:MAG: type II toxin-antitoxin system HipA family toxin [Gammaproteobacteria bacterium]
MMIFRPGHTEAYVWFWLPGSVAPVICGKLVADNGSITSVHRFVYGRSYREQAEVIPLVPHDLPVLPGEHVTRRGLPGIFRDAAPDAWGRRVLIYKLQMSIERGENELTEIDHLLAGGQGVGALHFQTTAESYQPKDRNNAGLEDMLAAAEAVETNTPLPPELEEALLHGTSIGGARPKALLHRDEGRQVIAKFSSSSDTYPMVRLESLAMNLAQKAGIETVMTERRSVMNKDVLLVDRFDTGNGTRRHFFSALTALDLDEMEGRYASYPLLAEYLRKYADEPLEQCRELYRRLLFNIMIGNTDDHAKNHAMFWDGKFVRLTPAYDICVLPRIGLTASQAMEVGESGKQATMANALTSCRRFGLNQSEARQQVEEIETAIRDHWQDSCEQLELPQRLSESLWQRAVLSPAIFEN